MTAHIPDNGKLCVVATKLVLARRPDEKLPHAGAIDHHGIDPRCLHPPEETEIKLTYTRTITLRRPGLYRYRLILHKRSGEILYSNTQEIRAIVAGG